MNERVVRSSRIKRNFDVRVIRMGFAESLADIGKPRAGKLTAMILVWLKLFWECLAHRPALCYFTLSPTGWAAVRDLALMLVPKAFRIHVVLHVHGSGLGSFLRLTRLRWLYRLAFRGEKIVLLSPLLRNDLGLDLQPRQIAYIPNGIPDELPAMTVSSQQEERATCKIVFLSNMMREKGPLDVLKAVAEAAHADIPITCTFVGQFITPMFRREFEDTTGRLGLRSMVKCVGPVYGPARFRYLSNADVFLLPSYNEAFPLAVIEAMAASLPVVSTSVGALADMVVEGETGYLVPPGDWRAIAAHIRTLAADPKRRRTMGMKGRERYLARYTLEQFESKVSGLLVRECASVRTENGTHGHSPLLADRWKELDA